MSEPISLIRRTARAPALHFALLGGLLFAAAGLREEAPAVAERRRIEVPRYVLEETRIELLDALGRPLSPEEEDKLMRFVADETVLFHHAKRLGLDQSGVAARRLEQIAGFVSTNPHEAPAQAEWMEETGADYGDRILRRILADEAKRLIRAPALVGQPRPERVEAYYAENRSRYLEPATTRISHVAFARAGRQDPRADALAALAQLAGSGATPTAATSGGDRTEVPPDLPALRDEDLERRFGAVFVKKLGAVPEGRWAGPIPSRDGFHLVFVHERTRPRQLTLDEVRRDVLAGLKQQLADELYQLRMRDVREQYEVVVDGRIVDDEAGT